MSNQLTFSEFAAMTAVSDILTEEILSLLESIGPLKDQSVGVVARLESGDIAKAIASIKPELKRQAMAIAVAILAELRNAGYGAAAEAVPTQEITIKYPTTIESMSLRQLIETAVSDPDRKTEAYQRILAHHDVQKAQCRTDSLAWVINGVLDAGRTIAYIQLMGDKFTRKQLPSREDGEKLLTLGEALGVATDCYFHPLDGSPLRGADEFQIDWTQELDPETHKAAIYALKTGSKIHPGFSYSAAQALLKGGAEWSLIIKEYWAALDRGDAIAQGIQIRQKQSPTSMPGSRWTVRDFGVPSSAPDDSYYENLVRSLCVGEESIASHNQSIKPGVYSSIYVGAHNTVFLQGVVFLQDCTIGSHNVSGTVIVPPGKRVMIRAHNVNIDEVRCKSWHEVATVARLI
jgi:hypothetical protein